MDKVLNSARRKPLLNAKTKLNLLKTAIHLGSLFVLIEVYYLAIFDALVGDPVKLVIHTTGMGSFNLLLLTLCVSPLAKKLKASWLMQSRRLLGVYTAVYALCHLLSYIAFELQFDFALLLSEIIERPYITIGMAAILLLIPLTITSLKYYQRKMGRNWQKLHNWVYLIIILVGIHFYWSVKSDITEPMIYFMLTFGLLAFRWKKIKGWFRK